MHIERSDLSRKGASSAGPDGGRRSFGMLQCPKCTPFGRASGQARSGTARRPRISRGEVRRSNIAGHDGEAANGARGRGGASQRRAVGCPGRRSAARPPASTADAGPARCPYGVEPDGDQPRRTGPRRRPDARCLAAHRHRARRARVRQPPTRPPRGNAGCATPCDAGTGPSHRPRGRVHGRVRADYEALEPARSIDVGLIDDRHRRVVVDECWNTFGDIGAAARSSDRKVAEAEALAVARWGDVEHHVGLVWIVRATAANRALVARYPEVFAARIPRAPRSGGWTR